MVGVQRYGEEETGAVGEKVEGGEGRVVAFKEAEVRLEGCPKEVCDLAVTRLVESSRAVSWPFGPGMVSIPGRWRAQY